MINYFRSRKVDIDEGGVDWFLVSCYDHKTAQKVKGIMKTYGDYKFKKGDEAQFRVPSRQIMDVLSVLGIGTGGVAERIKKTINN